VTPPVVFFDAVGTLIHPDPPAPAVYAAVGRRFGSRLDAETIAVRFRAAFRRQENIDRAAGWRTDAARELARWRAIVAETLSDAADPEACFRELFAHFARPESWAVDPEGGPTLAALADRGCRIGLASNFDARLRGVAAGLPALRPASTFVLSAEVGWRKPATEFFQALAQAVRAAPEQILFVGDHPVNDYDGARAAGLSAVLYDPLGECRGAAVRRVARFGELLAETA
jgi:putative hydrolase of the HAD superfamily